MQLLVFARYLPVHTPNDRIHVCEFAKDYSGKCNAWNNKKIDLLACVVWFVMFFCTILLYIYIYTFLSLLFKIYLSLQELSSLTYIYCHILFYHL